VADHKNPIPWEQALEIASEIEEQLAPACQKIAVAGSLRRRRPTVNDIEILCIPKSQEITPPGELFPQNHNTLDALVDTLIENGTILKRLKVNGTQTFGKKTKLLLHKKSKIPVDLFITDPESWFNCLVSKTGGKDTNIFIAGSAKRYGLRWLPTGPGFRNHRTGEILPIHSEEEVFQMVKLSYLHPYQRP